MNGNIQKPAGERHADGHFGCLGMLDGIMHRFLHGHADVVPGLARNLDFMRQIQHMKAATKRRPLA